jgi:hypothetical protein
VQDNLHVATKSWFINQLESPSDHCSDNWLEEQETWQDVQREEQQTEEDTDLPED